MEILPGTVSRSEGPACFPLGRKMGFLMLFFMWMGIWNSSMAAYHTHAVPEEARRGFQTLKTGVVSCDVGAGNRPQLLWKSNQCSPSLQPHVCFLCEQKGHLQQCPQRLRPTPSVRTITRRFNTDCLDWSHLLYTSLLEETWTTLTVGEHQSSFLVHTEAQSPTSSAFLTLEPNKSMGHTLERHFTQLLACSWVSISILFNNPWDSKSPHGERPLG